MKATSVKVVLLALCHYALSLGTSDIIMATSLAVIHSGKYSLPVRSLIVRYRDQRNIESIIDCAGLCVDAQATGKRKYQCNAVGFVKKTRSCTLYYVPVYRPMPHGRVLGKSRKPVYASLYYGIYVLFDNCGTENPRRGCMCEARTYKGIRCVLSSLLFFTATTFQECYQECSIYVNCRSVSFTERSLECNLHGAVANDMTVSVEDGTFVEDFDSTFAFVTCDGWIRKSSCTVAKYIGVRYKNDVLVKINRRHSLDDCIQHCITYRNGPCSSVSFDSYHQRCVLHASAMANLYVEDEDWHIKVSTCDIILHEGISCNLPALDHILGVQSLEECVGHCSEFVNCRGVTFSSNVEFCSLHNNGIIDIHQQSALYDRDSSWVHAFVRKCENHGTSRIHNCDVIIYAGIKYSHHRLNRDPFNDTSSLEHCIDLCLTQICQQCLGVTYNIHYSQCTLHARGYSPESDDSLDNFEVQLGTTHASIKCHDPMASKRTRCGVPAENHSPSLKHRIINGREAMTHSWPWQVLVSTCTADRPSRCGGVLLPENDNSGASSIVLTVAHCLFYKNEKKEKIQYKLDQVYVTAGKHNLKIYEGEQRRKAIDIAIHPGYDPKSRSHKHDVALILADGTFIYTDTVFPICLPKTGEGVPLGKTCVATGWGANNSVNTSIKSDTLQQLLLSADSDERCIKLWEEKFYQQIMLCGSANYEANICYGDSGGPFQCYDEKEKVWKVYGLASFVDSSCISQLPGVFTRVSHFREWIDRVLHHWSTIYY